MEGLGGFSFLLFRWALFPSAEVSETQSRGGLLVGTRVQSLGVPLRDR